LRIIWEQRLKPDMNIGGWSRFQINAKGPCRKAVAFPPCRIRAVRVQSLPW